jgi:hypothetical protein
MDRRDDVNFDGIEGMRNPSGFGKKKLIVWSKLKKLANGPPMAQNTSAPLLHLSERRIASSRPAHRASSSQALKRRRPAPALRPAHLRSPFLLSCCTSSARPGRCCPAPCSPSRPRLGVPSSRRTAGARVSAENRCGARVPVGSPSSSLSSHSVVSSNFTSLFNFCPIQFLHLCLICKLEVICYC